VTRLLVWLLLSFRAAMVDLIEWLTFSMWAHGEYGLWDFNDRSRHHLYGFGFREGAD
jgi:hypothetical protein